jgi:hypothetical protein
MNPRKIPIILCIDVEPLDREIDRFLAKDWDGVEETFRFLSDVRLALAAATGAPVKFSWFFRMDPQIADTYGDPSWVVRRYGKIIEQLEGAEDELGLHTHAWRWDERFKRWVVDHADQEWVERCLRMSFEAYRRAFGRSCDSFRFGDHWMNNATIDLLESLGVRFDLTVEPGMKPAPALVLNELHTGSLPDYTVAPRRAYRPAREDFRKEANATADRQLWMIPLSTGRPLGRFATLKRAARAIGIDLRRNGDAYPLNLRFERPLFGGILEDLFRSDRNQLLVPVVRTGALVKFPANVERNMRLVLSHPLVHRFRFVRPAEAIELVT